MNILLISQCQKNALKETRRIIDQFAERCGERTWQTAITQAGLETLYKLLKQSARKNSAIACYCTRGKNKAELMWIVGDKSQFNEEGRVPTNRTKRNILRSESENSWQYGTSIQIVATLAALLHDLGKSTEGFQNKLKSPTISADPYRHEWISLQLFLLMIEDCGSNEELLTRLAEFEPYQQQNPNWFKKLAEKDKDTLTPTLDTLPSLAKWIGWLIVTHHRMAFCDIDEKRVSHSSSNHNQTEDPNPKYTHRFLPTYFFNELKAYSKWVKNAHSEHPKPEQFWRLAKSVTTSDEWLKQLKRWANKALNHPNLMQLGQLAEINNAFLLHLSRTALMVGDHNFSSLDKQYKEAIPDEELIANTDKDDRKAKQRLDEHLLGVAKYTTRFARLLPFMPSNLPTLNQHKALTKRTTTKRFMWQNHAFDLAKSVQSQSDEQGFFGVNMASTGCGKTLANARIMYALADPKQGARFTIALGLRVLTLQTGQALKERLGLGDKQIATLVGGQASKTLFELAAQENDEQNDHENNYGSGSQEQLIDGWVADGWNDKVDTIDQQEFGTIIQNDKARALIYTPLISCTVDHLIQATECHRGGKYIAPTLRLLTSDLILDEPDDFDQSDLPALARLVHLAGVLGSKVLLSSATLTPDLIQGLFDAYQAGRKIWQQQQQKADLPIVCGWFDEFNQQIEMIATPQIFSNQHQQFVNKRVKQLEAQPIRRCGEIIPAWDYHKGKKENEPFNSAALAEQITQKVIQLHDKHSESDPKTGKKISMGLIRIAHTENVIALAKAIYQLKNLPNDTQLHLVVYHAKQLLLLRSILEEKLDRLLNRSQPEKLFEQPEIRQALDDDSTYKSHIFIVIGTPVTEVGRDHDYDWAIIEPSSMRSIIQLVGRVWRHRPDKIAKQPNVAILPTNLRAIKGNNGAKNSDVYFTKPGFESKRHKLSSYKSQEIIPTEQLANINAIARIVKPEVFDSEPKTLAALEHQVMADLFNIPTKTEGKNETKKINSSSVTCYWQPELAHHYCIHLQLFTPFRQRDRKQDEYVCFYNPDNDRHGYLQFCYAEKAWQVLNKELSGSQNETLSYQLWDNVMTSSHWVKPWLTCDLKQALQSLAKKDKFNSMTLDWLALNFATVSLFEERQWCYHPWFGFYKDRE